MKRSITSVLAAATMLVAANVNAGEVYFFSPNGSGEGYSWEDAMSGDDLATTLNSAAPGDVFYLMEGTYYNKSSINWFIPEGVTIVGGFPASATGTNVDITYPTAAPSIFDADITNDGKGDNGAVAYIIIGNPNVKANQYSYFDGAINETGKDDAKKVTISGLVVKNSHTFGTSDYQGGAMLITHSNVELNHVIFENNKIGELKDDNTLSGGRGGVVCVRGSYFVARDCVWRNNQSTRTGVALLVRQRLGGTTEGVEGSEAIIDRCSFINNTVYNPELTSVTYGGTVALADNGGTMIMNNCTGTGTDIYQIGSFARTGGGTTFYSLNNTFYNCNTIKDPIKGILSIGNVAYLANTICVNVTDEPSGADDSVMWFQRTGVTSGGYNVWGSLKSTEDFIVSTDNVANTNTVATVFGSNALNDDVIAPLETYRTVTTADLVTAATSWGINDKIDVTVDQKGNKRLDTTVPGAYDVKATSGIEDIVAESDAEVIAVEYYNIQGQKLNVAPENGIYIQKAIKADGTVKASKLVK